MQKIYLILVLIIGFCDTSYAQEIIIIINGLQVDRPLTLDDFTGKPTDANTFDGYTSSTVEYSFKNIKENGDSIFIVEAVIKVKMNSGQSWIKKGREINYLLKHEQGHFDIKKLWGIALKKAFSNISLPKYDLQNRIDSIATQINNKYLELDKLYDKETDHSKNKIEQERWNGFFKANL